MTGADADGQDMRDRFKYLPVGLVVVRGLKHMRMNLYPVALAILLTAAFALTNPTAGAAISTQRSPALAGASGSGDITYSYKFENPRFHIRIIEIDLNSNGAGELRFTRGESDEVLDCKVKLLPATMSRIR